MTTLLQLDIPPTWNHCPVFLPYVPHTISTIVPGYLGILIPFILFSLYFFIYLYGLWNENFVDDMTRNQDTLDIPRNKRLQSFDAYRTPYTSDRNPP